MFFVNNVNCPVNNNGSSVCAGGERLNIHKIMKLKYVYLTLSLVMLLACGRTPTNRMFIEPLSNDEHLQYTDIVLDTIILNDEGVESSLEGFTGITKEGLIYFIDKRFCWYYTFDTTGACVSREFGQGSGSNETTIGKIAICCTLPDDKLFLLGYQLDHYIYDRNFNLKQFFVLTPDESEDMTLTSKIYTHTYNNLVCHSYGENIYFNMYSEHPEFNYLEHTKDYLDKCRHISEVNVATGKDGNMYVEGYPDIYKDDPNKYVIFLGINFDIDNRGNFYISYEADSVIYKCNSNFEPVVAFGFAGNSMDLNYVPIHDYKTCRKYYRKEREEKGYYKWIEYIDETGLLFRSYQKGINCAHDGLQIYSGNTLVADLEVPKNFRIAGYHEPYYYSYAIANEEKERLEVYQFRLD
jgi:hypothetical protein